jgi:hypothetical protein
MHNVPGPPVTLGDLLFRVDLLLRRIAVVGLTAEDSLPVFARGLLEHCLRADLTHRLHIAEIR